MLINYKDKNFDITLSKPYESWGRKAAGLKRFLQASRVANASIDALLAR